MGVVVVIPGKADTVTVRGQWDAVPAGLVIRSISQQLEEPQTVIRRDKAVYYMGEADEGDLISRVYRVPGKDTKEYVDAVTVLLSSRGRIANVSDRVLVRDLASSIEQIDAIFAGLAAAGGQYVVELRFVELTESWARRVGVDWETVGRVTLEASAASGSAVLGGLALAELTAVFEATETTEGRRLITQSRLHVVDGDEAEFQAGDTVPVLSPILSSGTFVGGPITNRIEYVDTGLLLKITVRSEPDGRLRLHASPELSEITGFVEGNPIRSRRRVVTSAVLEPGGVVVLGGFTRQALTNSRKGLPGFLRFGLDDSRREDTRIFIVLRVTDPSLDGQEGGVKDKGGVQGGGKVLPPPEQASGSTPAMRRAYTEPVPARSN